MIIVSQFGWPNTPARGDVAFRINFIMLWASVLASQFVIFFVVDAIVFLCQLIHALRRDVLGDPSESDARTEPRWAESTLAYYRTKFDVNDVQLNAIVLMDFIALRTKVVTNLVYFPFFLLALMILSRNRLFDDWTMPVGLVAIFTTSVLIVILCAILVRMAAENVRERILEILGEDLVRAKGLKEAQAVLLHKKPDLVPQIEALLTRVRSVHTGAFAPYSQQPIVRALLLPLTTFGGPAVLEYLSSLNF